MDKIKMTTPIVEMDGDEDDKNSLGNDQKRFAGAIYRSEDRIL